MASLLETLMERTGQTKVPRYAKEAFGYRAVVQRSQEFQRIAALPRRQWQTEPWLSNVVEIINAALRLPTAELGLWPIQCAALHDAVVEGGAFLPIGVGQGKAFVSILAAVAMDAERPVLFVPADLRDQTREHVLPLMRKHFRLHPRLRVIGYSELSLAKNAEMLERFEPDLIVLDECFTGDTEVMTPTGWKQIKDVRIGDEVVSYFYGRYPYFTRSRVQHVFVREAERVLDLVVSGHTIKTTANHPFLTPDGWKPAGGLDVEDEVVSVVQEDPGHRSEAEPLLFDKLLRKMANVSARIQRKDFQKTRTQTQRIVEGEAPEKSTDCEGHLRKNEKEESDAKSRDSGEGLGDVKTHQTPSADPGRERTQCSSATIEAGIGSWLVCRICSLYRQTTSWLSDALQNRYREPTNESRGRGRWWFAQFIFPTKARQKENPLPRKTGMARVESIQQGRLGANFTDRFVYNLEVSGPHTYIVKPGIVVHNCHSIKNKRAGRTRRLVRYFREHPETKCVAMSGTVSNRSIKDFAHIAEWCLKTRSPVPRIWQELSDWADAIDEGVDEEKRVAPGALEAFCHENENVRQGFRRRLVETPGVVASAEHDLGVSLRVRRYPVEVPAAVREALAKLRNTWETPNGDIVTEAVDLWRHARELSLGFWYRWDPPAPRDWLDARREWKAYVREKLKPSKTLDTELQVWNECERMQEAPDEWHAWVTVRDSFKPNSVAEWIDDFALRACAEWIRDGGIVWTSHRAFGERLAKPRFSQGLFSYFGAGTSKELLDYNLGRVALSISSHGQGKNLERYSRNLIVAPPSSGKTWEQVIGRTHREGQEADEVCVDVFLHAPELEDSFAQARADAVYLEDALGNRQKLNYADVVI